jgi:hypothetical protein
MKAALAIAIGLIGVATLAITAHPAKSANNCNKSCSMSGHMMMPGMPLDAVRVADNPQPRGEPKGQAADEAMQAMNDTHIIAGHMSMTKSRPASAADRARADAILTTLRSAVEPFKDYRAAERAGYKQFLPDIPQPVYHFTNWSNAFQNVFSFDPARPTSLMYRKTSGGYELIGAMYTAAERATDEQLNTRVPLSIATWHLHTNFCAPPSDRTAELLQPHTPFGLAGTITTADACQKAGGTFKPVIYNWMVHVWPFEKDPSKVWATEENPGAMGHMGNM